MEISPSAPASATKPASKGQQILTEIPSGLKTLARLVVRGFHSVEDALIIDMLVRYPCMREDDLSSLLKFDKKNLRSRMAVLKNDKLVQVCILSAAVEYRLLELGSLLHINTTFISTMAYNSKPSLSFLAGEATYRNR